MLANSNQLDWNWERGRYGTDRLMLDEGLYGQLGALQVLDDCVQEDKTAVFLCQVTGNNILVFYLPSLLLSPAIFFVRPGEAQAISLARPLTFLAIQTGRQRPITADLTFYGCQQSRAFIS